MALYRDHIFPRAYDFLMGLGKLEPRRAGHLATASGEILEIGIGTGLNLPHYPESIDKITGLDANAGMIKKLRSKLVKQRIEVELALGSACEMPFEDASFDTVISTHSLCSISFREQALSEVLRVLKPNGRFLFLEHGLSPEAKIAKWQKRLNGIQRRFAVGCTLDMQVKNELESAGFRFLELKTGYQPRESKTHGYLYEGIAVRA